MPAKLPTRIGIVDLGTNSIRGFVFACERASKPRVIGKCKEMVRLGDHVFDKKRISPAAFKRTLAAFGKILQLFREHQVKGVVCIGTSALRIAKNSGSLIRAVKATYGIRLRKLSEEGEAHLIGQGVLAREATVRGKTIIIDIGGGSVEIILCQGRKLIQAKSLRFGAAAVQQLFLKNTPPAPGQSDKLRFAIRQALIRNGFTGGLVCERAFGSSGSIRTLCRVGAPKKPKLSSEELNHLISRLIGANKKSIGRISGIEPKRVDLILGAALVLEEILAYFGLQSIQPTKFALKDGILVELSKQRRSRWVRLDSVE